MWGAHGKPRVEAAPQLHVSISHAADRVAVAVTALGPVGVDLEPAGAGDFDGLADVALTPRNFSHSGDCRVNSDHPQR